MQIHELNNFAGTPGADNFLAIDNGSDTGKISGEALLKGPNDRIDNLVANVLPDSVVKLLEDPSGIMGSATLAQSVANFDYLDLYFLDSGGGSPAASVRVPVADFPALITIPGQDSNKTLYATRFNIAVSGTNINVQGRLWEWGGVGGDSAMTQSGVFVALLYRVDGIKISSNTSAELTDIRLGADGVAYPTAGDAVRANDNRVEEEALVACDWIESITKIVPNLSNGYFYIRAKAGDLITIKTAGNNHAIGAVFYTDGTSDTQIAITGYSDETDTCRFRAEKDIEYIRTYNDYSNSYTITKEKDPLYLTNYYDKSTKQSGYFDSSGNIITGSYYHSDYIPVALGETIIISGYPSMFGTPTIYLFDDQKNYAGRRTGTLRADGLYEIHLPLSSIGINWRHGNIWYVAFNMTTAGADTAVLYKDVAPYDTSVQYGEHLPEDEELSFNMLQKAYIAGQAPAELINIRIGADGVTYPTAGDAVRANDNIARSLAGWENTFALTVLDTSTGYCSICAKEGDIITISPGSAGVSGRFTVYYKDGTTGPSTPITTSTTDEFRFRAAKDIERIGIYNDYEKTYTITKEADPLYITNYYDKSTKQSGWINGGSIASGYYHSDFIPVALCEKVILSGYPSTFGTVRAYVYDKSKNYIGYKGGTLRADGLYEVDLSLSTIGVNWTRGDIYYVAFNMTVAGSDTAVLYKNVAPYDTSVLYGQHLPEDQALFFNQIQKDYIGNAGGQPIAGKKIAYNGDSICESRITPGNTYNGGAYAKMIADITGGTYENRGQGGGTLASGSGAARQIVNDVTNMTNDADLICFEGGINDYWLNVPLGTYSESDYSSTPDITTICGALESIFRQATQKWVGKPICFVIVHKIKSTVYIANSAGYTFAEAREKMIGICKKYAIPYYDAFAESGLNAYNDIQNTNFLTSNSSGTPDGCHPNAAGYEKYYVPQLITLFNSIMPRS